MRKPPYVTLLFRIFIIFYLIFFITGSVLSQQLNWVFGAGSSGTDIGNSTGIDNSGNVYACGGFSGTVDFDPSAGTSNLTSNGSTDIFIAKYNSSGQVLWAFSIGNAGTDNCNSIAIDAGGNIYVTGFFRGSNVDFDPSAATAYLSSNGDAGSDPGYGGDIFIAKYNSSGQYQWAFHIGGSQLYDCGVAITTDGAGNVYVGGYFKEIVDFDPSAGTYTLNSANGTIFLLKYSTNGAFQWAFNTGLGDNDNAIFDIKTDNTGNIYVVGYFQGTNIDFDPSPATALLSSIGGFEVFFAKYTTNGQYQFAHKIGGSGTDVGRGIELDNSGNIYIIGDFNGSNLDFDPAGGTALLTSMGGADVFLAKYSNTGQYLWAFNFGGNASDIGWKVSTDYTHLFITGGFTGTSDMDPSAAVDNLVSSGGNDIFLGKYTLNGEYLCSFKIGSSGDDYGSSVRTNGTNTFHLTGSFRGSNVDFDPASSTYNLNSAGGDDIFLTKYTWPDNVLPTGTLTGSSVCNGQQGQLTFSATAGIGPFTIVFNDGTTNITQTNVQSGVPFTVLPNPAANTTYTLVSIKDAARCSETNFLTGDTAIIIVTSLNFDFYYKQDVCNPLSIQFFNAGPDNLNPYWNFGDGTNTSGTLQPFHTYPAFGNYTVKHSINNGACTDTITKMISVNVTQENSLIVTNDTTICNGATKQLITQPSLSFCWSPASYLNNINLPNPVTSTPQSITYYFTAEVTGANLIVNGNFNSGNTGFTSAYVYATSNTTEGEYFVGTSPQAWNASLSNCPDHTTGNGNMMLVNGSPVPDVNVWKQTVIVTPNTNYAFSTWLQALWPPNPAQLQFSINGKTIGTLFTASLPTCTWTQFYTTWNSGNNTAAVISIVNKNTQIWGNDFALDDISFAPVFIKRDSVNITVDSPFVRTNNDTAICAGSSVQLNTIGAITYSWTPAAGLSDPNIANPVAAPASTTQYIVTGTNINGCTAKDSVLINVNPGPIINITSDTMICNNNSVQLYATGGVAYQWSPASTLNNPNIPDPVALPIATTTYTVIVTDANSCSNTDSVLITLRPPPLFSVSSNGQTCTGSPFQLNAGGGDLYTWSPETSISDPLINNPVANPLSTTVYTVTITDTTCNESAQLSTTLTVLPLPMVQADKSNDLDCSYDFSQLTAGGADTYIWSPAASLNNPGIYNPVARPTSTTLYTVQGTDNNGCINYDTVTVKVGMANKGDYLMANAFTPNNDGLNDCFGVRYWGVILELDFSIYNRWGELIFHTTNPSKCWDGTYKGRKQDPGVFVYMVRAKTSCENSVFRKGTVVLIR